ncbi:CAS_1a_G0052910.mRNA.1.CDS.1 [Saccharomyces cerevisiae]|nr:CAS_1a_G0052910.mRNA.1.CDS.1 [Saccharomyces cerevisiae]CAI7472798.1 CAS_1a_G0052910.mRNA.1.CDS.1 [Saccharomyces cerevisiae]
MDILKRGNESDKFTKIETESTTIPNDSDRSGSLIRRMKDSFKQSNLHVIPEDLENSEQTEQEKIQWKLASQPYQKVLSQRHLTMIAIGGTLGTGLFIGLGYSLASGPAALLIGFLLVGTSMFCVVQSAAELSCQFPVSGSYATHVSRFIDESVGFTVATNYALAWLISFPSELIGCALTISYWNQTVNPAVWVAIFYVFIMVLNLFGVRGFAETEFALSIIKVIAIFIFIIIGIVLIAGGGPNSTGYIGAKYWHDPGAFAKPVFKNLCNTFVSAAFSFGGSELVLLTSTESKNISAISRAAKGTFWRIAIFYITTVVIIGCLVPYNDPRLLSGSNSEDVSASPFVIALSNTGSMGAKVSNFMNVVILVAVVSVCNSCVYASSRLIQALGASGQLPSVCSYMDRKGRPLVGIGISGAFGLFRMALKAQGRSNDEIAYKSILGVYGGILGCVLNALLIAGEIYVSAAPVGSPSSAEAFFEYCLSIPIMIVVYFAHRFYRRDWKHFYIKRSEIDLDTGESFWSDESSANRKIVKEMFNDFLNAGAEILMTTTYQTSYKSVSENTPIRTLSEYNNLLNRIVDFSRNCIGEDKYLIGCIGPWGAHICREFTGDYGAEPENIDFYQYFKPQLENFNKNDKLDLIGFETIPNIHELKAILSWDESILSRPFYIGLSVHEHGVLRDGTTMEEIAQVIKDLGDKINPNFSFLGINCVSFNQSPDILESLHQALPNMALLAYPNSGEVYDTEKKIWLPNSDKLNSWDTVVKQYISSGARIIGGCCRTSPKDIQEISAAVKKYT